MSTSMVMIAPAAKDSIAASQVCRGALQQDVRREPRRPGEEAVTESTDLMISMSTGRPALIPALADIDSGTLEMNTATTTGCPPRRRRAG